MSINLINRLTFLLIIVAPSIIYELYFLHLVENPTLSILGILGTLCIMCTFLVAFIQLFISFGFLYSRRRRKSLISLQPLYLLYKDSHNERFYPNEKEMVVHTLMGFTLFILTFTNLYQYLTWSEIAKNIETFNTHNLRFVNAFYFTTVTTATVGYGDILPKSPWAKFLVTTQIWISFVYIVSIFSTLPNKLNRVIK